MSLSFNQLNTIVVENEVGNGIIELLQGNSIGGKTQEKKQTCAKLGCLSWACYRNHDICQLWWRWLFLFCPVSTLF